MPPTIVLSDLPNISLATKGPFVLFTFDSYQNWSWVYDTYYYLHLLQYLLVFLSFLASLFHIPNRDEIVVVLFKNNLKLNVTLSQWIYFNWHTVTEIVIPKWRQSVSTLFGPSLFVLFIYIQELQVFQKHRLVGNIITRVYIIYPPNWDTFESERGCYL